MENEVRAPRAGVVGALPVGIGQTVELGDDLVILE
jgi:biotin carboxyl carrier protein